MKYDLAMARPDFDKADRLVRAVLLQSGRADLTAPRLVTSDSKRLLPDNKAYLRDHTVSLGVCFQDGDNFDIWISPSYIDPTKDLYIDTVLHELCHGYLGLYNHNQRWKRFYGRVLYQYHALVKPIDIEGLITTALDRYTKQGQDESYPKYLARLDQEKTSISKISVDELPSISRMYERLNRKEGA